MFVSIFELLFVIVRLHPRHKLHAGSAKYTRYKPEGERTHGMKGVWGTGWNGMSWNGDRNPTFPRRSFLSSQSCMAQSECQHPPFLIKMGKKTENGKFLDE